MIDFKLYPIERLVYVYTDDIDGIDIYDFNLSYIGDDTPKIVLTNSIYKDIICSINNVKNGISDEHVTYISRHGLINLNNINIMVSNNNDTLSSSRSITKNLIKKYSVLTFVFGDYDILREPYEISPLCEYVCVTDNPDLHSDIWKIVYLPNNLFNLDGFSKSFYVRYHPFEFVSFDICLIIDASVQIKRNLDDIIEDFITSGCDIGLSIHWGITNAIREYSVWVEQREYPISQQNKCVNFLHNIGFTDEYKGAFESGIKICKRNDINARINECVWANIKYLGVDEFHVERVDQIILGGCMAIFFSNVNVFSFNRELYQSSYLQICKHHNNECVILNINDDNNWLFNKKVQIYNPDKNQFSRISRDNRNECYDNTKHLIRSKPLVHLIHWYFIDRQKNELNAAELYHLSKLFKYIIPQCTYVVIYVYFDSMNDEYKKLVSSLFTEYKNVIICFDVNEPTLSEYKTYRHIFDYDNCYVAYSHFKGVTCLKNTSKLSEFGHVSLEFDLNSCEPMYDIFYNVIDNDDKYIFYANQWHISYPNSDEYIDGYSDKYFCIGSFQIIDIDKLKHEVNANGIVMRQNIFISEYFPSFFKKEHQCGKFI